jgi:tetratricopeptide (TPR) repeat protein
MPYPQNRGHDTTPKTLHDYEDYKIGFAAMVEATRINSKAFYDRRVDLFISYSRKNQDFARKLVSSLEGQGFGCWFDQHDLPPAADFWEKITEGIDDCDTFIFIMSPQSLASPICMMEVAYALKHNKRIIAIICEKINPKQAYFEDYLPDLLVLQIRDSFDSRDFQEIVTHNRVELGFLNWIFCENLEAYETAFAKLLEAINTDLDYVRQHTLLSRRVAEWERNLKNRSYLMRGEPLRTWQAWIQNNVDKSPSVTSAQIEYITASVANERRVMWIRLTAVFSMIVIILVIGLVTQIQGRITVQATAEALATETQNLRFQLNTSLYYTQGLNAYKDGDFLLARQFFELALAALETEGDGSILNILIDLPEITAPFEVDREMILNELARSCVQMGEEESLQCAEENLLIVRQSNPNNRDYCNALVIIYREQKRYNDAHAEIDRCPNTSPKTFYDYRKRILKGSLHFYEDDWDQVIALLEPIILERVSPDTLPYHFQTEMVFYVAASYVAKQEVDTACEYWKQYVKMMIEVSPTTRIIGDSQRNSQVASSILELKCF